MERIGVDPHGIESMAPKALFYTIKLEGVESPAANILKQEMLSLDGDAAVARGVIDHSVDQSDVLLIGSVKNLRRLIQKLKNQPFGLDTISQEIEDVLTNVTEGRDLTLSCGKYTLDLNKRVHIMGILNITPDSFYDGGRFLRLEDALSGAEDMVKEGADIIDIGSESSRPGADPISVDEELRRILPVVKALVRKLDIPISVDTYKSPVAKAVLDEGASIINDISGLKFDEDIAGVIAGYDAGVVIMHIPDRPKTMQENPHYESLFSEIISYLRSSIEKGIANGIKPDKFIIDPGIGFGKRKGDNLQILKNLSEFKSLGRPLLIGISRKSFIGEILNLPVEERLEGTLAASAVGVLNGANILRVHDIREVSRVVRIVDAIRREV
ncbi:MAG: dihydropteroate synthase [Nitrospinae bacterium]|nr:dihydropteroate synthase [Nitrospinota bacterium]